MAIKTLKTKIIIRNDIKEAWERVNPVLRKGEFGVENDSLRFKIGDGTTEWNKLKYAGTQSFGDGVSIETNGDGAFCIVGFENAIAGAMPRKREDGSIEWVVPEDINVDELQAAIEGLDSDFKDLQADVDSNSSSISVLNGDSSKPGSVAYQIAEIVAGAPESFDTLKELADWISTHGTDAATMASNIKANADEIEAIQEFLHEHPNQGVLDAITAIKVNAWDAAEENVIDSITLAGRAAVINKKVVDIPAATSIALGLVKPDGESIEAVDGTLSVKGVGISKVYVEPDTNLMFVCGNSNI